MTSITTVKKIFDTLPTGYYLGTRAEVVFDDNGSASYCSPSDRTIHIGGQTIIQALQNTDSSCVEKYTRTLLYHECAHLLLTPAEFQPKNKKYFAALNIVEDERIETILKDYFAGVNFKEFVFKANNWTPQWKPENGQDFFYGIVRFRQGPRQFLDEIKRIISTYQKISAAAVGYDDLIFSYERDVINFYDEVQQYWKQNKDNKPDSQQNDQRDNQQDNQQNESQSGENENKNQDSQKQSGSQGSDKRDDQQEQNEQNESQSGGNEDGSQDNGQEPSGSEHEGEQNGKGEQNSAEADGENEQDEAQSAVEKAVEDADRESKSTYNFDRDDAKTIMDKVINEFVDAKIISAFERIIIKNAKRQAMRSGISRRYSGKVDIKSVAVRNDYRWFVRGGDEGNRFNRTHITLWIDCSGSFTGSIQNANKLVYALNDLEARMPGEFSFDVVGMNDTNFIHPKTRPLEADGGNQFGVGVENIFKSLNKAGWDNYNVAVWDGDMFSWGQPSCAKNAIKLFDTPRTVIVSDLDNQQFLTQNAKRARSKFIRQDYCNVFIDAVIELLSAVLG